MWKHLKCCQIGLLKEYGGKIDVLHHLSNRIGKLGSHELFLSKTPHQILAFLYSDVKRTFAKGWGDLDASGMLDVSDTSQSPDASGVPDVSQQPENLKYMARNFFKFTGIHIHVLPVYKTHPKRIDVYEHSFKGRILPRVSFKQLHVFYSLTNPIHDKNWDNVGILCKLDALAFIKKTVEKINYKTCNLDCSSRGCSRKRIHPNVLCCLECYEKGFYACTKTVSIGDNVMKKEQLFDVSMLVLYMYSYILDPAVLKMSKRITEFMNTDTVSPKKEGLGKCISCKTCIKCCNTYICISNERICLKCAIGRCSAAIHYVCSTYVEEFLFSNSKYVKMMKGIRNECEACGINTYAF